jgi:6-pyruvoyltetrahydropterin/6-carboxytetrahydropterin synthase
MKLRLDGWALDITFSACHFLPGHGKCNRLHGHNYAIHLELEGEPGGDGLLHDFVDLKTALRGIAQGLDHCVLLPGNSNSIILEVADSSVTARSRDKVYQFPEGDVKVLDVDAVSAEALATHVLEAVIEQCRFGPNVTQVGVGVDEGQGQGVWVWREP